MKNWIIATSVLGPRFQSLLRAWMEDEERKAADAKRGLDQEAAGMSRLSQEAERLGPGLSRMAQAAMSAEEAMRAFNRTLRVHKALPSRRPSHPAQRLREFRRERGR